MHFFENAFFENAFSGKVLRDGSLHLSTDAVSFRRASLEGCVAGEWAAFLDADADATEVEIAQRKFQMLQKRKYAQGSVAYSRLEDRWRYSRK